MRDTKRLISYRDISEKTRIGRVWSKQDHRICRPASTSTVFWIGLSKSIWNFWIMKDLIIKFFWMIKVCWKIARKWDGDDTGSQRDVTLEVPAAWETPGGSDSVTATYWLNHIVPLLIKKSVITFRPIQTYWNISWKSGGRCLWPKKNTCSTRTQNVAKPYVMSKKLTFEVSHWS